MRRSLIPERQTEALAMEAISLVGVVAHQKLI